MAVAIVGAATAEVAAAATGNVGGLRRTGRRGFDDNWFAAAAGAATVWVGA